MIYMICYDIPSDQRRTKVRKTLEGVGDRVQFSVFECDLTEGQYHALRRELKVQLDEDKDSIIFYTLCGHCAGKTEIIGSGTVREDEEYYIV